MLEKESLAVHVLGDMLYNVEGMEKIRAAKGVVLVETADVSPYAEVAREIELSKRQGAGILGDHHAPYTPASSYCWRSDHSRPWTVIYLFPGDINPQPMKSAHPLSLSAPKPPPLLRYKSSRK